MRNCELPTRSLVIIMTREISEQTNPLEPTMNSALSLVSISDRAANTAKDKRDQAEPPEGPKPWDGTYDPNHDHKGGNPGDGRTPPTRGSGNLTEINFVNEKSLYPESKDTRIALFEKVEGPQQAAELAARAYVNWGSGALGIQHAEGWLNRTDYSPKDPGRALTLNANAWNGNTGGRDLPTRDGTTHHVTAIKKNGQIQLVDGG